MPNKFVVEIELDNDTCFAPRHIEQYLFELAFRLKGLLPSWEGVIDGVIIDDNGNTVGKWEVQ